MSVCLYVCVSMYVCMDGWMDGCMDACMHACMYVWSRVPCSRERELGGPYHWGGPGIRSPDSYIYIYMPVSLKAIQNHRKANTVRARAKLWTVDISVEGPWHLKLLRSKEAHEFEQIAPEGLVGRQQVSRQIEAWTHRCLQP